jgi:CheY-like chemotaxis protein
MPESKKVLIVDDSEDQVIFSSRIVEDLGYEYKVANNGNEALETLKTYTPDLILLDIMMPKKTGLNVLKKLNANPDQKNIPVIIVSGASDVTGVKMTTGDEESRENYGDEVAIKFGQVIKDTLDELKPDGFIEKPVNPEELIAKIK